MKRLLSIYDNSNSVQNPLGGEGLSFIMGKQFMHNGHTRRIGGFCGDFARKMAFKLQYCRNNGLPGAIMAVQFNLHRFTLIDSDFF